MIGHKYESVLNQLEQELFCNHVDIQSLSELAQQSNCPYLQHLIQSFQQEVYNTNEAYIIQQLKKSL